MVDQCICYSYNQDLTEWEMSHSSSIVAIISLSWNLIKLCKHFSYVWSNMNSSCTQLHSCANDYANMLFCRGNVSHVHHLSLVCFHANICFLALNSKYPPTLPLCLVSSSLLKKMNSYCMLPPAQHWGICISDTHTQGKAVSIRVGLGLGWWKQSLCWKYWWYQCTYKRWS